MGHFQVHLPFVVVNIQRKDFLPLVFTVEDFCLPFCEIIGASCTYWYS